MQPQVETPKGLQNSKCTLLDLTLPEGSCELLTLFVLVVFYLYQCCCPIFLFKNVDNQQKQNAIQLKMRNSSIFPI